MKAQQDLQDLLELRAILVEQDLQVEPDQPDLAVQKAKRVKWGQPDHKVFKVA
jgi:hypothetical protein